MNSLSPWIRIFPTFCSDFKERWGHTAIYYKQKIFVFGGYSKDLYYNDLFQIDLSELKGKKIPLSFSPCPRSNHSSVFYSDALQNPYMIIHGGTNHFEELDDVYYLDLENFTWIKIQTQGYVPCSTEHSAEIFRNFMFIIGGEAKEDLHDSIRILNLESLSWKIFKPKNQFDKIFMRIFHSSCLLENKIFVFSGCDLNFSCYNDMVILNLERFDFESQNRIEDLEYIDYYMYNYTNIDEKCYKSSWNDKMLRFPYPRWGANMLVKNSSCFILFGGRNKRDFSDIWLYNSTHQRWLEISAPGKSINPRRKSAGVLIDNCLFICGGFCDIFLQDFYIINLKNLEFFKTYEKKSLVQIPKIQTGNLVKFVLPKEEICVTKDFFFKKLIMKTGGDSNFLLTYTKEKTLSGLNQVFILENVNISKKIILLFYEIGFIGKLFSYVTLNDLEKLIELAKYFNQKIITCKLTQIFKGIQDAYPQEQNFNLEKEIFNLQIYKFNEFKIFFSRSFYHLKDKSASERKLISIHSKILLKFIDTTEKIDNFHDVVSEKSFNMLLNYIYNGDLPKTFNNEVNILLEMLFYAKFFKIKSLFKEIQMKLIEHIHTNTIPIFAIFAHKFDAKIILNNIFITFLKEGNLMNWENFLTEHLSLLINTDSLTMLLTNLKDYFQENLFYYTILQLSFSKENPWMNLKDSAINILNFPKYIKHILFDFECFSPQEIKFYQIKKFSTFSNDKNESLENEFGKISDDSKEKCSFIPFWPNSTIQN